MLGKNGLQRRQCEEQISALFHLAAESLEICRVIRHIFQRVHHDRIVHLSRHFLQIMELLHSRVIGNLLIILQIHGIRAVTLIFPQKTIVKIQISRPYIHISSAAVFAFPAQISCQYSQHSSGPAQLPRMSVGSPFPFSVLLSQIHSAISLF